MDDNEAMGDSEIIISLDLMEKVTEYCFMVAAYNGELTVIVEGALNTLSGTLPSTFVCIYDMILIILITLHPCRTTKYCQ